MASLTDDSPGLSTLMVLFSFKTAPSLSPSPTRTPSPKLLTTPPAGRSSAAIAISDIAVAADNGSLPGIFLRRIGIQVRL